MESVKKLLRRVFKDMVEPLNINVSVRIELQQ